jgi:hypothetical protein
MADATKAYRRWCCPFCGLSLFGKSKITAAAKAFIEIMPIGRQKGVRPGKRGGGGSFRLMRTVYLYELAHLEAGEYAEFYALVRASLLHLARLMGIDFVRTVYRDIEREVIRKVYVPRTRKSIRQIDDKLKTWAQTPAANDKQVGRALRGKGGRVGPVVQESWNDDEAVGEGGIVVP